MRCALLFQESDLVFATPLSAATGNIRGSTIHISLTICIRNKHAKLNSIFFLWMIQYILIIDKISIVELNILSNIVIQLAKARGISNNNTTVLGVLPIVIIMGDFYKFSPISGRAL